MSEALRTLVRRPYPLHPLLFAAFPVLFLFAANVKEASSIGVALSSLGLVLGAAVVLLFAGTLVLRDGRRAALVVSSGVLLFFSYGHVIQLLEGMGATGEEKVVAGIWAVLFVASAVVAMRMRKRLLETTRVMNIVAAFLVVANVVRIAIPAAESATQPAIRASAQEIDVRRPERPRDVYLIVLDRYGSRESLLARFGYDNQSFLDYLRDKGFYVAGESRANYPKTDQSLAASLNLAYLDDLLGPVAPEDQDDLSLPFPLMHRHLVGQIFRSMGYRHVHIGSWYEPTRVSPDADVRFQLVASTEFSQVLLKTTPLPAVARRLGIGPSTWDPDELGRQVARYQFQKLAQVQVIDAPTFTFAHVILPHPPYIFDADGSPATPAEVARRPESESFRQQIEFLNGRLEALMDRLLAVPKPERPIVVLQADEGPHPAELESNLPWPTLPDEVLRQKFGILNALYLPGVDRSELDPSISPVNTWRLIFGRYFGAELPLLPDRSYVFRDLQHLYEFVDVTDRVR